ncbi:MAG: hypothetical protein M3N14_00870 [Bacteroidota bacterium]|nr:hypothetical protein [Bacteroidota bacterium]
MRTLLVTFILVLTFTQMGCVDLNNTIDKDLREINDVPYNEFHSKELKIKEEFGRRNPAYMRILAFDTLAIPYLIQKITDTAETHIHVPCSIHSLKIGDVAFALLNDIIPIPFQSVTGSEWDSYSCDSLPDGAWDYLHNNRLKFQSELTRFFASRKGQIYVTFFKRTQNQRNKLMERFLKN